MTLSIVPCSIPHSFRHKSSTAPHSKITYWYVIWNHAPIISDIGNGSYSYTHERKIHSGPIDDFHFGKNVDSNDSINIP